MRKHKEPLERLYETIDVTTDGCWQSSKKPGSLGYVKIYAYGFEYPAHRFMYMVFVNDKLGDLVIDHLCRNRACVNPDHLEAVTDKVNILRGYGSPAIKARLTHCPNGHNYGNNKDSKGYRLCRICQKKSHRRFADKIKGNEDYNAKRRVKRRLKMLQTGKWA